MCVWRKMATGAALGPSAMPMRTGAAVPVRRNIFGALGQKVPEPTAVISPDQGLRWGRGRGCHTLLVAVSEQPVPEVVATHHQWYQHIFPIFWGRR